MLTGLVTKWSAPSRMACTAMGMSPMPVITTMAVPGWASRTSRIQSRPLPSGRRTSSSSPSTDCAIMAWRASASDPASVTAKPFLARYSAKLVRTAASSSRMRMLASSLGFGRQW